MSTIPTYFEQIITKQKKMGYKFPSLLRPPASEQLISEIEHKIGFPLNTELFQLYTCADGTISDSGLPSGATGLIPIHRFMSLSEACDRYYFQKLQLGFNELFEEWNSGYKPDKKLFPFLEDGAGNQYWVDLNEGANYGKIYWTNTYPASPGYAFNSLTAMFKTITQAYCENVFFLDEDGYLDEDYDRWEEIAAFNNPGLKFWNQQ
jgi:hypothetical protein